MKKESWLVTIIASVLLAFIGCLSIQEAVTPAWIDENVTGYIADANLPADIKIPRLWWTSVADAKVVDILLDFSYEQKELLLNRALEDNARWYELVKGQHTTNLANAKELQGILFDVNSPIGALVIAGLGIGVGSLGISKPSDKKEIETLKNGNKVS